MGNKANGHQNVPEFVKSKDFFEEVGALGRENDSSNGVAEAAANEVPGLGTG